MPTTPIWDRLQGEAKAEPEFLTVADAEVVALANEMDAMGRLKLGQAGNEAYIRRGAVLVRGLAVLVKA